MPLTSISKVYKNFPSYFADKVTEHVRKRTNSYSRGDCPENEGLQDINSTDKEVFDVCSKPRTPASRRPNTSRVIYTDSSSNNHTPPVCLPSTTTSTTTKRSDTPLGEVSDADSDADTPRLPTTPTTPTNPPDSSPRPNTASYFTATVNYLTKPRWPKSSPRTCTSLDNVDLWESDEESEHGEGSGSHRAGGFDKIDGVAINPNKTIDFSELRGGIRRSRSPVACKRNKLEKKSVAPKSGQNHREQRLERLVRDPRCKPPAGKGSGLLPDLPCSRAEPHAKHDSHHQHADSERAAPPRQLRASVDETNVTNVLRQVNSQTSSRSSRRSAQKQPLQPRPQTPQSQLPRQPTPQQQLPRQQTLQTHQHQQQPRAKAKPNKLSTAATLLKNHHPSPPLSRGPQCQGSPASPARASHTQGTAAPLAPSTSTSKYSHPDYALMLMRKNNRSPEPTMPDSHTGGDAASKDSPNTRKVKFQNFVTVREGEESGVHTEDLRTSNNSAQQYKQMYLGGYRSSTTPPLPKTAPPLPPYNPANYEDSEDGMDQSTWRLEMVC